MTQLTNSVFLALAEALFGKNKSEPSKALDTDWECIEEASVHREASAGVFLFLKGISDREAAFTYAEAISDYIQASEELSQSAGRASFNIQEYSGSEGIEVHASIQFEGESEDVMNAMLNAVYMLEVYVEDLPEGAASTAEVSHHFNATSKWVDVFDDSTSNKSLV